MIILTSFFVCCTSYHSQGITGGYSSIRLAENIFQITFKGNGYTSSQRAADFCLLRSAEIAKENGYLYFIIIENQSTERKSTYTSPTTKTYESNIYSKSGTVIGSGRSTTSGGQTYDISRPSANNTIVCFKTKEEANTIALYDVNWVIKSIREKYYMMN